MFPILLTKFSSRYIDQSVFTVCRKYVICFFRIFKQRIQLFKLIDILHNMYSPALYLVTDTFTLTNFFFGNTDYFNATFQTSSGGQKSIGFNITWIFFQFLTFLEVKKSSDPDKRDIGMWKLGNSVETLFSRKLLSSQIIL